MVNIIEDFGRKIIYNKEIIGEVEHWKINVYQGKIEIKTFGKTEYAKGLKSWEGEAIIVVSEKFVNKLTQISTEIVKLELQKDDKSYSGEAKLDFAIDTLNKIGDKFDVKFIGFGELKIL